MSIRMRKQTLRTVPGSDKLWVPGPGQYGFESLKDVGRDPRQFQAWKSPNRRTDWYHRQTDAADVMYSSMMDHKSCNSSVIKGERRMATVLQKCLPRTPVELDSRRANEKLKFKVFEIAAPAGAGPILGPGKYNHARPEDIGNETRKLQSWTTPIRDPSWWYIKTDAPEGPALLQSSPFNKASKNKCGGYLKDCWPVPEDEHGRPVTSAIFAATRITKKTPATA